MELSGYVRAIVRGWWVVLLCAVSGFLAAAAITAKIEPLYQSTVQFFVVSPPAAGQSALQSDELSRGRIASYAALVKSDKFIGQLVQGSGAGLSEAEAQQSISASSNRDTLILTVVVTLPDQAKTVDTATAIAGNFGAALNGLEEGRIPASAQTVLKVVSGPTVETEPVSPRVTLNLGLGVLLGLAAGIGVVVARRIVDRSLRTPEEVETATGLPLLVRIPASRGARSLDKLLDRHPESLIDEAARRLRTNLEFYPETPHLQAVVVTSATSREGKSTVALLLAKAWAEAGERVLLVEADLRHPQLALEIGLTETTGLANVLAGQLPLYGVIQKTSLDGLDALVAGPVPLRPTELLGSKVMSAVLLELRRDYARIVVDATPLQPLSDAALMGPLMDGTIVVVRHEHVTRELLTAALENLSSVNSRVLGIALNVLPDRLAESHRRRLWPAKGVHRAQSLDTARPSEWPGWAAGVGRATASPQIDGD